MKSIFLAAVIVFFTTGAIAEEPAKFYKNTYPEHALKSRLEAEAVLLGKMPHSMRRLLSLLL